MDTINLSSNWKKLQQTLKAQPSSDKQLKSFNPQIEHTKPPKRKAQIQRVNADNTSVKRQRKDSQSTPRIAVLVAKQQPHHRSKPARANMGGYLSVATPNKQDQDAIQAKGDGSGHQPIESPKTQAQAGKFIAIDCEMVGTTSTTIFSVKSSNNNDFSILARVSVVSYAQDVLYDSYVLPPAGVQVTDYRTKYSGITPWHLNQDNTVTKPRAFEQVQNDVAELMRGRILVGHAINNDLAVLGLSHPKRSIRDTSSYPKYRALAAAVRRDGTPGKGRKPALKMLTTSVLGYDIQNDDTRGHDSVEDARATMALFQREKKGFEEEAVKRFGRSALTAGVAKTPDAAKSELQKKDDEDDMAEQEADFEDEETEDEAADAAEVDNAEDINTGRMHTKSAKNKKKKKKKGKYRK